MEQQLLMSLRSAVLDKLHKEHHEVVNNLTGEVQSLQSTEKDLFERATNLQTIQAQMISELVGILILQSHFLFSGANPNADAWVEE